MLTIMLVKTGEERICVLSVDMQTLSTIKIVGHFYTKLGGTLFFLGVFH